MNVGFSAWLFVIAVATSALGGAPSNFMIGVTAAASGVAYFALGEINPDIAGPVAVGSVIGALLGAHFLIATSGERLRLFFVVVLLALAVQMCLEAFGIHPRGHAS